MIPVPPELDLLRRRMEALTGDGMRLSDWDHHFVATTCYRAPQELTPRQAAMVEIICWRRREQLAPELRPAREPSLPARHPDHRPARRNR